MERGSLRYGIAVRDRGESSSEAVDVPPKAEWLKANSIVKSWIFFTLLEALQERLVVSDPKTAKSCLGCF
ncbi:hypothetical protein Tco_0695281 [Tanacetum coccineum]